MHIYVFKMNVIRIEMKPIYSILFNSHLILSNPPNGILYLNRSSKNICDKASRTVLNRRYILRNVVKLFIFCTFLNS
jgi:hypothetical protein